MKNTFFDQRPAEKDNQENYMTIPGPVHSLKDLSQEHALCVEEQGSWFLEQSEEIGDVVREHGKERIYVRFCGIFKGFYCW